jgi:hypothetical protein
MLAQRVAGLKDREMMEVRMDWRIRDKDRVSRREKEFRVEVRIKRQGE